jgi:hypothetical protein
MARLLKRDRQPSAKTSDAARCFGAGVEREFAGDDANKRCETQRELSVGGSFLWISLTAISLWTPPPRLPC